MKPNHHIRALGLYLTVSSLYQAVLYAHSYMRPSQAPSILDPRFGFWLLPGGESLVPWIEWASAIWLFSIGLWLTVRADKALVLPYLIIEGVLAFPAGLYIGASLFGDIGQLAASASDSTLFLGTFVASTCLPFAAGLYLLLKRVR